MVSNFFISCAVFSASSEFFAEKKLLIVVITPNPKSKTKIPLKKFIFTATVSGLIQNREAIGLMSTKKNAIKLCHKYGKDDAGPVFHRITP